MEAVRIERPFRGRAQPHIVIHTRRRVAIRLDGKGRLTILISPNLNGTYATDSPLLQVVGSLVPMRVAALPLPYLHNPVILARRLHHQVAFLYRVGQWFLYVDILSGLTGPHRRQAMPMVRRTDDDHIHVFIIYHPAPVFIQMRNLLSGVLLHIGGTLVQPLVVHVAQRNAFHLRILQECTQISKSHAATAYQGDFYLIAGSRRAIDRGVGCPHQRTQSQACSR